jgi:tetrahydromethanopterin S-methyltransferase subunit F
MAEPSVPDPFATTPPPAADVPISPRDIHGMTDVITRTFRAELGRQRAETPGILTIGVGVFFGLWLFLLSILVLLWMSVMGAASSASKYVEDYKQRAGLVAPDLSTKPAGSKQPAGSRQADESHPGGLSPAQMEEIWRNLPERAK